MIHQTRESKPRPAVAQPVLSEGQRALIELIQSFDPDLRHTLKVVCVGSEPAMVERVSEQADETQRTPTI